MTTPHRPFADRVLRRAVRLMPPDRGRDQIVGEAFVSGHQIPVENVGDGR